MKLSSSAVKDAGEGRAASVMGLPTKESSPRPLHLNLMPCGTEIEGGRKALSEWGLELIQVPDGTVVMMMDSGPMRGESIDLSPKNVDLLFSRAGKTYHALLPRGIQTTFARPTTR